MTKLHSPRGKRVDVYRQKWNSFVDSAASRIPAGGGLILTTENGRTFRRLGMFKFDPAFYHDETPEFYRFHREKQRNWVRFCELREIIIE
jgi:hypothetical protein